MAKLGRFERSLAAGPAAEARSVIRREQRGSNVLDLRWWLAAILLCGMACAQQRLIEGGARDDGRLHDVEL